MTVELKERITKIIKSQLTLEGVKVFIFGGSLKDKNPMRDIDIGIMAKGRIEASVFFKTKDELDNLPIFQKIELVDFNEVSDDFKEVALQNIEMLYEN